MVEFYEQIVGLRAGARPAFRFDGAWLYSGDSAVVHLVEAPAPKPTATHKDNLSLEHFAFRSKNLADFLAHLRQHRVAYRIGIVPGLNIRQVNIHDPDGNHIHIDFAHHEQADLADYSGTDQ